MVEKTGDSPSDLKLRVMSPGGTTVEGLSILEKHAFKFAVINAVKSASDKAAQLNK